MCNGSHCLYGDVVQQLWTAFLPLGTACLPLGTTALPSGTALLPLGTASLPLGTASLPLGPASLPFGIAPLPLGTPSLPPSGRFHKIWGSTCAPVLRRCHVQRLSYNSGYPAAVGTLQQWVSGNRAHSEKEWQNTTALPIYTASIAKIDKLYAQACRSASVRACGRVWCHTPLQASESSHKFKWLLYKLDSDSLFHTQDSVTGRLHPKIPVVTYFNANFHLETTN